MRTRKFPALALAIVCSIGCSPAASNLPSGSAPNTTAPAAESAPAAHRDPQPEAPPAKEAAAPDSAASSGGAPPASGTAASPLRLEGLSLTPPAAWTRKEVSSSFVLAEFVLPKAEGADADGRLTISTAGGSVEQNLQRWRDQFGGKPEKVTEERLERNGLVIHQVDYSGEFNDQRGPFAPGTKRAGYRMMAAVIQTSADAPQLHFVKATGPAATIEAHAESIRQFFASASK